MEIRYCVRCRWLLRAAWLAQELLQTFPEDLGEVALVPGEPGCFEVRIGDQVIFTRTRAGRFPEPAELKRSIRDRVAPDRDLGHTDRAGGDPPDRKGGALEGGG